MKHLTLVALLLVAAGAAAADRPANEPPRSPFALACAVVDAEAVQRLGRSPRDPQRPVGMLCVRYEPATGHAWLGFQSSPYQPIQDHDGAPVAGDYEVRISSIGGECPEVVRFDRATGATWRLDLQLRPGYWWRRVGEPSRNLFGPPEVPREKGK